LSYRRDHLRDVQTELGQREEDVLPGELLVEVVAAADRLEEMHEATEQPFEGWIANRRRLE
jgi:hypothetical protein